MTAARTYTYEQYDAIVAHNLTMRQQLEAATKLAHGRLVTIQKQGAIIRALHNLLSQSGWRVVTGNGSPFRLMREAVIMPTDKLGKAFVTVSAEKTGTPWNVRLRDDGTEATTAQVHFDTYGEVAAMREP